MEFLTVMAIPLAALGGGLLVLLFSADKLVGASEEIGRAFGVPPFIIGITVLAVGTSLPELVTALFAIVDGSGEIVAGTVVGSNIANLLLILGVAAFFAKDFEIHWDILHGDVPILFGSLLLLVFVILPVSGGDMETYRAVALRAETAPTGMGSSAVITFWEGLVLIAGYLLYLHYYFYHSPTGDGAAAKGKPDHSERPASLMKPGVWIVIGLIGVPIGANFTVEGAVNLAAFLLVGKEVIAASMIAFGTSLPELVVAVSAVRRGNHEMALGNVIGSNIFNTFVVLGVAALLAPFVGLQQPLPVGENSILFLQVPYYVGTVILYLVIVMDKRLTRTEGLMILLAYVLFIGKLFSWL